MRANHQTLTEADLRRSQPDAPVVLHQRQHFIGEIAQRAVEGFHRLTDGAQNLVGIEHQAQPQGCLPDQGLIL